MKKQWTAAEKALIRRYLIWCYKTTKEDLDRIDRYFTQLDVDHKVLAVLKKTLQRQGEDIRYTRKVEDFEKYMKEKEANVLPRKYSDLKNKKLQPDYWYLKNRLQALEMVIGEILGKKELRVIQNLYENEMVGRILTAREHA